MGKVKRWLRRNKTIFIIAILVIIILLVAFGTKIALFVNFILGNDIVVRLNADKEYLSLAHNQEEKISFRTDAITNLFCVAVCYSEFLDVSDNLLIDEDEFTLTAAIPLTKEYKIRADKKGTGRDMYRYSIECRSKRSLLCHTKEKPSTRSVLVTVDYDLNEDEKTLKSFLRERLELLVRIIENLKGDEIIIRNVAKELGKTIEADAFIKEIENAENKTNMHEERIREIKNLWGNYDYEATESELQETLQEINNTQNKFEYLRNDVLYSVDLYNNLLRNLTETRKKLIDIKNSSNNSLELSYAIDYFNLAESIFEQRNSFNEKQEIIKNATIKIELLGNLINITETNATLEDIKIIEADFIFIGESFPTYLNISFDDPLPQCCVFGECKKCCMTEECRSDTLNYPVIYLHGHAVNKDLSAEYSLEGFNELQQKLEEDGYLNAGTLTLYTPKDSPESIWGLINTPVSIKTSYYFDIFKEPENYIVVQTKSENIDTYAVRLDEIIELVKYKTGKPKVKVIAFSMGGLVARRYVQIFGEDNIDRLILVGTPNNGIVGEVAALCPVLGESLECRDMRENSLFINKLNREMPNIPIYNLVGTGCLMNDKLGDGAVLEEKALLDGATNYIINGTCRSRVKPLHLDLLDVNLYPEVYETISDALEK